VANSRNDFVLKAAENGFIITDDAINALQAPSVDSMSVFDRILSGLVSAEKKAADYHRRSMYASRFGAIQ